MLFYYICRSDYIMIKREYVVAKRIVLEDNVINSKAVLKDAPRQVMVVTSLDDVEYLTVKKGGYVILDFGRKLQGGVVLSVLGASLGDEGGADIVNRSLDLLRDMTPSDKWMNTIVSYTMWWVITHRDWYMYTGNLEYLLEQKEYFYAVVENIMNLNDENNEYNSKMHSFIDWSAKDKPQEWAGLRAVTVMSLEAAADIANAFGDYEFSKKCILKKIKLQITMLMGQRK